MPSAGQYPSTGLPSLDNVFQGLRPGDNIVWQVDSVKDYLPFVEAYCNRAVEEKRRIIYLRFAKHEPLLEEREGVEIRRVHPEKSFEFFLSEVHDIIGKAGRGAFYVFDCLSDLVADWYSDRMLGNFFALTCPYLYELETVTYFSILRDRHSASATSTILGTTQIMADIYRHDDILYVHPLKVAERYSPTMFTLHVWKGDEFQPVTESATISETLTSSPWSQLDSAGSQRGYWQRTFQEARDFQEALDRGEQSLEEADAFLMRLLRMSIARDGRMLDLAARYLTIRDALDIRRRMIGTGLIGGKAVGMLLARAILRKADVRWGMVLEPHDSFFVGADVFYTFLVENGLWWTRQKERESSLDGIDEAREKMSNGVFPDRYIRQFRDMLDYFGQSPIIVRSSSLLEDNFGNAFAGKYESVFCANQGTREERLQGFLDAVRTVYASTMNREALTYRATRGLLDRDEQMSILVQRVSGGVHGNLFFPQVAGVGLSFNPYVWSEYIDPEAGVLRLVFGLGTRAVNRTDDDYTRIVALNAPERFPHATSDTRRGYSQRRVDFIDLKNNTLHSADFSEVVKQGLNLDIEMFADRDEQLERQARERGLDPKQIFSWYLTFDRLVKDTPFLNHMWDMLRTLQEAYEYPVDIEFTTNFLENGVCKINLLQCRPLQVRGLGVIVDPPADIADDDRILEANGPVIGYSRSVTVDRVIYVVPSVYGELPINERYSVARTIGELVRLGAMRNSGLMMLLGPGRWATTSPDLGVPVSFAEISRVGVICEIVAMRKDLVPDASLGTHFFNELVEMDILYLAFFPEREGSVISRAFFEEAPNKLPDLLPSAAQWANAIRVIDPADYAKGKTLRLNANALNQKVVCYMLGDGL